MSNKHLEPVSITLSQIVKGIRNGIYRVPKFQRKFVWKSSGIESLGDSLLRGYPVSSILTMPTNGNLKIAAKSLNLTDQEINDTIQDSEGKYVLDGQQRLTSIGRIYCDLDEQNQYFYDMLSMLIEQFPHDELELTNVYQNTRSPVTECLCRSFRRQKNGIVAHKQKYRFISCKKVMDGQSATIVNKFINEFDDLSIDKEEKYTNYLNQQFGQLSSYALQEQRLDPFAELGLVCRVFEKVNSTGAKLTAFDLINAKSFETNIDRYKSGLSDYISTILQQQEFIDNEIYQACNIAFKLESSKEGVSEYQKLGRIVRILFLAELLENNQTPSITNNGMLMKEADFWFKKVDENMSTILNACKKIYKHGVIDLMPTAFLEYIIAVVCSDKRILKEDIFFERVRDYGLTRMLNGNNFNKSDLYVVKEFKKYGQELINTHGFDKYNVKSKPDIYLDINESMIDNAKVSNGTFKVIYYIMTKMNHEGKFSQDISGKYLASLERYDQHHIFPKATTKSKSDDIFNTICNIVPLNIQTNREDIKDMSFESYRDKLIEINGLNATKLIFENNLLPFELGSVNYEEYLCKRKQLIINYLQTYFKRDEIQPS